MFEAADPFGLRFRLTRKTGLLLHQRLVLGGKTDLLFRQRLILGAEPLQRRNRLHRCFALCGRQRSEVDLRKGQHGQLGSTVSEEHMPRSAR